MVKVQGMDMTIKGDIFNSGIVPYLDCRDVYRIYQFDKMM